MNQERVKEIDHLSYASSLPEKTDRYKIVKGSALENTNDIPESTQVDNSQPPNNRLKNVLRFFEFQLFGGPEHSPDTFDSSSKEDKDITKKPQTDLLRDRWNSTNGCGLAVVDARVSTHKSITTRGDLLTNVRKRNTKKNVRSQKMRLTDRSEALQRRLNEQDHRIGQNALNFKPAVKQNKSSCNSRANRKREIKILPGSVGFSSKTEFDMGKQIMNKFNEHGIVSTRRESLNAHGNRDMSKCDVDFKRVSIEKIHNDDNCRSSELSCRAGNISGRNGYGADGVSSSKTEDEQTTSPENVWGLKLDDVIKVAPAEKIQNNFNRKRKDSRNSISKTEIDRVSKKSNEESWKNSSTEDKTLLKREGIFQDCTDKSAMNNKNVIRCSNKKNEYDLIKASNRWPKSRIPKLLKNSKKTRNISSGENTNIIGSFGARSIVEQLTGCNHPDQKLMKTEQKTLANSGQHEDEISSSYLPDKGIIQSSHSLYTPSKFSGKWKIMPSTLGQQKGTQFLQKAKTYSYKIQSRRSSIMRVKRASLAMKKLIKSKSFTKDVLSLSKSSLEIPTRVVQSLHCIKVSSLWDRLPLLKKDASANDIMILTKQLGFSSDCRLISTRPLRNFSYVVKLADQLSHIDDSHKTVNLAAKPSYIFKCQREDHASDDNIPVSENKECHEEIILSVNDQAQPNAPIKTVKKPVLQSRLTSLRDRFHVYTQRRNKTYDISKYHTQLPNTTNPPECLLRVDTGNDRDHRAANNNDNIIPGKVDLYSKEHFATEILSNPPTPEVVNQNIPFTDLITNEGLLENETVCLASKAINGNSDIEVSTDNFHGDHNLKESNTNVRLKTAETELRKEGFLKPDLTSHLNFALPVETQTYPPKNTGGNNSLILLQNRHKVHNTKQTFNPWSEDRTKNIGVVNSISISQHQDCAQVSNKISVENVIDPFCDLFIERNCEHDEAKVNSNVTISVEHLENPEIRTGDRLHIDADSASDLHGGYDNLSEETAIKDCRQEDNQTIKLNIPLMLRLPFVSSLCNWTGTLQNLKTKSNLKKAIGSKSAFTFLEETTDNYILRTFFENAEKPPLLDINGTNDALIKSHEISLPLMNARNNKNEIEKSHTYLLASNNYYSVSSSCLRPHDKCYKKVERSVDGIKFISTTQNAKLRSDHPKSSLLHIPVAIQTSLISNNPRKSACTVGESIVLSSMAKHNRNPKMRQIGQVTCQSPLNYGTTLFSKSEPSLTLSVWPVELIERRIRKEFLLTTRKCPYLRIFNSNHKIDTKGLAKSSTNKICMKSCNEPLSNNTNLDENIVDRWKPEGPATIDAKTDSHKSDLENYRTNNLTHSYDTLRSTSSRIQVEDCKSSKKSLLSNIKSCNEPLSNNTNLDENIVDRWKREGPATIDAKTYSHKSDSENYRTNNLTHSYDTLRSTSSGIQVEDCKNKYNKSLPANAKTESIFSTGRETSSTEDGGDKCRRSSNSSLRSFYTEAKASCIRNANSFKKEKSLTKVTAVQSKSILGSCSQKQEYSKDTDAESTEVQQTDVSETDMLLASDPRNQKGINLIQILEVSPQKRHEKLSALTKAIKIKNARMSAYLIRARTCLQQSNASKKEVFALTLNEIHDNLSEMGRLLRKDGLMTECVKYGRSQKECALGLDLFESLAKLKQQLLEVDQQVPLNERLAEDENFSTAAVRDPSDSLTDQSCDDVTQYPYMGDTCCSHLPCTTTTRTCISIINRRSNSGQFNGGFDASTELRSIRSYAPSLSHNHLLLFILTLLVVFLITTIAHIIRSINLSSDIIFFLYLLVVYCHYHSYQGYSVF